MNLLARLSMVALVVPCIQCQAEVGDPELASEPSLTQAVLADPDGETPDCGEDGVCRLSVCDDDPDCPDVPEQQAVTWRLTGDVTVTPFSGVSSSDEHVFGDEGSANTAVYAVLSRERSDEPCHLAIGTEDLNDASDDAVPTVNHCGSGGPTSSTIHADFLDVSAGGVDDHVFIAQVMVCMNGAGTKVKGLDAVGIRLNEDGTTTVMGRPQDDRPNCSYWSGGASCPAGQIATAVNAYFSGSEPKDLTGITLSCRSYAY
jgi:hypothetical protein